MSRSRTSDNWRRKYRSQCRRRRLAWRLQSWRACSRGMRRRPAKCAGQRCCILVLLTWRAAYPAMAPALWESSRGRHEVLQVGSSVCRDAGGSETGEGEKARGRQLQAGASSEGSYRLGSKRHSVRTRRRNMLLCSSESSQMTLSWNARWT